MVEISVYSGMVSGGDEACRKDVGWTGERAGWSER